MAVRDSTNHRVHVRGKKFRVRRLVFLGSTNLVLRFTWRMLLFLVLIEFNAAADGREERRGRLEGGYPVPKVYPYIKAEMGCPHWHCSRGGRYHF